MPIAPINKRKHKVSIVEKLNPKKALVRLGNGEGWRVPYGLLFPIMDGVAADLNAPLCIEGEVVHE